MSAAIAFCVFCVGLGSCIAACGIGRILDRDEPVQGVVDLALAAVAAGAGTAGIMQVLP